MGARVTKDSTKDVVACPWSFPTICPDNLSFAITSPMTGNVVYVVGDSLRVNYTAASPTTPVNKLGLSLDNGLTYIDLPQNELNASTWGYIGWKITDSLLLQDGTKVLTITPQAKIRICQISDCNLATSSVRFTIYGLVSGHQGLLTIKSSRLSIAQLSGQGLKVSWNGQHTFQAQIFDVRGKVIAGIYLNAARPTMEITNQNPL
jgi:hypothetical protein